MNRVALLWERYITQGRTSIDRALAGTGGHWYNEIRRLFLAELDGVEHLAVPAGWSYTDLQERPAQPNTMQKRTAWAIQERRRVGNWSGVGSGKTLSAILASRVIDAHLTLIVTNNSTIKGWKQEIRKAYPDSTNVERLNAPDLGQHNYIILNYEKFQQANRNALVYQLLDMGLDFIVFDEVQFVKQRDQNASYRREALAALMCEAQTRTPALCVLGMSATPVINNLLEAKKLLEIVTGLQFPELQTVATINNALAMHRALMLHGFRYVPHYESEGP
jgi:superfamily II DNA or RNA helicase